MAHTPGEWNVCKYTHDYGVYAESEVRRGSDIALVRGNDEEARANAILISEAPNMKKALEAIVARINGEWDHPSLVAHGPLLANSDEDILIIAQNILYRLNLE